MKVKNVDDGTAAADSYEQSPKYTTKRNVIRVDRLNEREGTQTTRPATRLPSLSVDGLQSRPHPARHGNDAAEDVMHSFARRRGIGSRDYAVRCLALAQRFGERSWLQQVRQAVAIATVGVKRVYGRQPHLFAGENVPV